MYNYEKAVENDLMQWLSDNGAVWGGMDKEELREYLDDQLWSEDSVTGNASGSYWCDREMAHMCIREDENAMDYLRGARDDGLITDDEIGFRFLSEDWEWFDVMIRCYVLSSVVEKVVSELNLA